MNASLFKWCEELLQFPDDASFRLYERAKREQWQIDSDIDWPRLDLSGLSPTVRRAMANLYTNLQYGEMFGLSQAARVISESPYGWSRLVGATQVADEARHVEFFSRLVAELDCPSAVSPALMSYCNEVVSSNTAEEAFLGTQIILESFAQAIFVQGTLLARQVSKRAVQLPSTKSAMLLVDVIGRFVGRDEARHIAFGVTYLRQRWAELSPPTRVRLRERARHWCDMLYGVVETLRGDLYVVGIDSEVLRDRVSRAHEAHFRDIGLSTE
jgi:hypothetical protein